MWSQRWSDLIAAIHDQSRPTVLVTTGGGASAISELLAVPGASRTVLEAHVPYSSEALTEWLGRVPDQFCDERTALAMASVAAFRARKLLESAGACAAEPLGVSCTASLASDRPKRGEHRCFIAVQSPRLTASCGLILEKGARSRADEEALVGQLIVRALAEACGLTDLPACDLRPSEMLQLERQIPTAELATVWSGTVDCSWSLSDGTFATQPAVIPRGLLCGAFDPLHRGHEELRRAAERRLGGAVAFEMSIANVDKPPLDYLTIERRRRQFQMIPLALTNAPRFWQKARIFPGTTFVVGSDTAVRILDVKYYGGNVADLVTALRSIRDAGCRFLVATRVVDGKPLSLAELNVPAAVRDLFDPIPEPEFRNDVSSTQLRRLDQSRRGTPD